MAHRRPVNFSMFHLVILLLSLKSIKLARELPGDVIEVDGDRFLAKVALTLDFNCNELVFQSIIFL